jgi:hypothetical protein
VNVREVPESNGEIIGTFQPQEVMKATEEQDSWIRVEWLNPDAQPITGWVLTRYVSPSPRRRSLKKVTSLSLPSCACSPRSNKVRAMVTVAEDQGAASGDYAAWLSAKRAELVKMKEEKKNPPPEPAKPAPTPPPPAASAPTAAAATQDEYDLPPPPPKKAPARPVAEPQSSAPAVSTSGKGSFHRITRNCTVRGEASANGETVGSAPVGAVVKELAVDGDWMKIEFGRVKEAWVLTQNKRGVTFLVPSDESDNQQKSKEFQSELIREQVSPRRLKHHLPAHLLPALR